MGGIDRIHQLKKLTKEANNIVKWQEDIYTSLHNINAEWIVSGSLAWARISANFPRTIAELLSDHNLAHHPLSIIPSMDDAHIPNLETLGYGGPFATAQIPSLDASKITTGTFALARIPTMDDAHIPDVETLGYTNPFATGQIPNLDASKITTGTFGLARIPTMDDGHIPNLETLSYGAPFANAQIPNLSAKILSLCKVKDEDATPVTDVLFKVINGVLHLRNSVDTAFQTLIADSVPSLDASKITTGVFGTARIPNLDASKITTGTFALARIPTMDDAHIPDIETLSYTNPFAAAQIPNLDAGKITTGTFALARIPSMDWTHISVLFPRTIADLLSNHDLARHPLSIIPTMDDAHIPNLETLSYGGPFAVAQIPTPLKDKVLSVGLTAQVAITANQVVYVSAANKVSPAAVAHRSKVIGVALNDAAVDAAVEVQVFGKATVVADGTIAVGELVAAAPTAGRVVSLTSITPTFSGNALAVHGHTFTGSALGTHNHTFTGSALPTHNHSFTGSGGTTGGPSTTTTVVTSVYASTGTPSTTKEVAGFTHYHSGTTGGPSAYWVVTRGMDNCPLGHTACQRFDTAGAATSTHTHGFTTGTPSITVYVASSTHTHTIGKSTGSVASSTHTHGFTPSGSISSKSAGTPSGSISSKSAGTPSGSINNVSAGTPSGTISAIPLGQTIGRAITAAAGAGNSFTIIIVPSG